MHRLAAASPLHRIHSRARVGAEGDFDVCPGKTAGLLMTMNSEADARTQGKYAGEYHKSSGKPFNDDPCAGGKNTMGFAGRAAAYKEGYAIGYYGEAPSSYEEPVSTYEPPAPTSSGGWSQFGKNAAPAPSGWSQFGKNTPAPAGGGGAGYLLSSLPAPGEATGPGSPSMPGSTAGPRATGPGAGAPTTTSGAKDTGSGGGASMTLIVGTLAAAAAVYLVVSSL